jgi:hypothetical protein
LQKGRVGRRETEREGERKRWRKGGRDGTRRRLVPPPLQSWGP